MNYFALPLAGETTVNYDISGVLSSMQTVYTLLVSLFKEVIDTITGNPLLYVPVLIALLGGLVMFAVKVIRKLGVRGVSSRR